MKKIISPRKVFTRREVSKGVAAGLALGAIPLPARAANTVDLRDPDGRATSSSATLGILTLVNDSATRAANGTPTRIFGWPFARGQIPVGQAPVFTVGGVVQPFSANPANARRYWPDGSLMYCAFMLRPTFSVQARGSRAVRISAGGRWPAAATRTAAEVYSQNLVITCPPVAPAGWDPAVPYGAWLTSANAGNIVQTRHWLSGDAGECWGFTINMSQTEAGAPHGLLVCNVAMVALTGLNGALGGFRFWADLRQPYYDVDTLPKQTRYFAPPNSSNPSAGINWRVASGQPQVPPNWPFPAAGQPFTVTPANVTWSGTGYIAPLPAAGTNNSLLTIVSTTSGAMTNGVTISGPRVPAGTKIYYENSPTQWQCNPVETVGSASAPVLMTAINGFNVNFNRASPTAFGGDGSWDTTPMMASGANLPAGMPRGLYWIGTVGAPNGDPANTKFTAFYSPTSTYGAGGAASPVSAGSGILTAVPVLQPFQRLSIGGADGEYISFQGTGSIVADIPLRSGVVDQNHWVASRVLPPYDTSLKGSVFGGAVKDFAWNYPYNPYSHGDLPHDLSSAGNGPYLAPIPNSCIIEFFNGSRAAYKAMLYAGLGAGCVLGDVVSAVNPTVPINMSNNTYGGMGPPATYWQGGGRNQAGWSTGPHAAPVIPGSNGNLVGGIGFDELTGAHMPLMAGWAYLRTGRLELLDRVVSEATAMLQTNGGRNTNLIPGKPYYNCTTAPANGEVRANSWQARTVAFANLIYPSDPSRLNNPPGVLFDGSQTDRYLHDTVSGTFQLTVDELANAATLYGPAASIVSASKRFVPVSSDGSLYWNGDAPAWMIAYLGYAACWAAAAGVASAAAFLENFAAHCNYYDDKLGGFFNLYHYYANIGPNLGVNVPGLHLTRGPLYADDRQWCISCSNTWYGAGAGPGGNGTAQLNCKATPMPSRTTLAFQAVGPWNNDWVPRNGDYIQWNNTQYFNAAAPAPLQQNVSYVVADVTSRGPNTYSLNLKDLSGNYMSPTVSGNFNPDGFRSNSHLRIGGPGYGVAGGYTAIFYSIGCWAKAITDRASFDRLIADTLYRVKNSPGEHGTFLTQSMYGTDARYAYRLSFT